MMTNTDRLVERLEKARAVIKLCGEAADAVAALQRELAGELAGMQARAELAEMGRHDLQQYEAPRESGVPVECDISDEDAARLNQGSKAAYADLWQAMVAAAPATDSPVQPGGDAQLKQWAEKATDLLKAANQSYEPIDRLLAIEVAEITQRLVLRQLAATPPAARDAVLEEAIDRCQQIADAADHQAIELGALRCRDAIRALKSPGGEG